MTKKAAKKTAKPRRKKTISKHTDTGSHNVNIKVLSGFNRFFNVTASTTAEELKKQYYKLALKLHPDRGGNEEEFKEMQNIYDELINNILLGKNFTASEVKNEVELDELYKAIINELIKYETINIELVGTWIWISGNTYPIKDVLKKNNFKFASTKKMWFMDTTGKGTKNRKEMDIDAIRKKYGSQQIKGEKQGRLNGVEASRLNKLFSKLKLKMKKRAKYMKTPKQSTL